MKIPLNWLRDYVKIDLPLAESARRITIGGLEVANVRLLGLPVPAGLNLKIEEPGPVWANDKIFVGQVVRVEPHPNADRLKLPTVDYGNGRSIKMVTGAPNLQVGDVGQKVVLALSGSVLFDGHATPKVLKELKPGKIRGEPSDAMVCSTFELGIDEEHEGIILLDDDAPVGTPLVDYLGDAVLEIDVLPNMARCLSLIGVAREVAALTGTTLKTPVPTVQADGAPIAGQVQVAIEDPQLSPRYLAALIRDVTIGPSPGWLKRRLSAAGVRPISNVVDITNYVMLEWGQPLHAFDYDVLVRRAGGKAPKIMVRPARAGETLRTLDGVDRKLTPEMLLIADEAGPIALAGVRGGEETEVRDTTRTILLESASFDMVSIRKTVRALNLPSEASARFSRGVPPAMVLPAAQRACELMRELAGGTVSPGVVDVYPAPQPPRQVELKRSEVRRILGVDLPLEECARLLRSLEYQVEIRGESLHTIVPEHRLDVQEGPADLIEDLARLYGYDNLPATLLADQMPPQATNVPLAFEERIRDLMVTLGLQEAITYSLTCPEREAPLGLPDLPYVILQNPISDRRNVMRHSLLGGLLEALAENLKNFDDVRLFEVGAVFLPCEGKRLPDEPRRLALALCGKRGSEFWSESVGHTRPSLDFFDLKGVVEALAEALHLPDVTYQHVSVPLLHPARSAALVVNGQSVGHFGELHPRVAAAFKLAERVVLVAEFDLDALLTHTPVRHPYLPISEFEPALRDIAVLVDEAIPASRLVQEIRAAGGDLLRGVRLFDLYRGDTIPAGKKSLAYALTYQAMDRTLNEKEIEKVHRKVEDRLKHVLKAQIRGQNGA
jgi:phenylalanyl-tRNA synthetase beta chain